MINDSLIHIFEKLKAQGCPSIEIDSIITIIKEHSTAPLKSGDINATENDSSIGYEEPGRAAAPEPDTGETTSQIFERLSKRAKILDMKLCPIEPVSIDVLPRHPIVSLFNEIDCRIKHGAESHGHLEYVHKQLKSILGGGNVG